MTNCFEKGCSIFH